MSETDQKLDHNDSHVSSCYFLSSLGLKHDNYTEILTETNLEEGIAQFSKLVVGRTGLLDPGLWSLVHQGYTKVDQYAVDVFKLPPIHRLLVNRPKVDAVIMTWGSGSVFAEIFDCPIILFSPNGPAISAGTTNVINYSVQPFLTANFIEPMTFLQRLANHAMYHGANLFISFVSSAVHGYQAPYLEQELGLVTRPPAVVMKERVALMLTCSHPLTHGAWPYTPNIVEVGGLQLRPPGPLPQHLKTVLDKASQGAILVSFGSSLRLSSLPPGDPVSPQG